MMFTLLCLCLQFFLCAYDSLLFVCVYTSLSVICLCLYFFVCCLFVLHYTSYSERVQKSYESYAPGYVSSRDSFWCQKGIKPGQGACQIFIDKEVCLLAIYTVSNDIMHLLLFLVQVLMYMCKV